MVTVPIDREVFVIANVGDGVLSMFGKTTAGSGLSVQGGDSDSPDLILELELGSGVLIVNQENS